LQDKNSLTGKQKPLFCRRPHDDVRILAVPTTKASVFQPEEKTLSFYPPGLSSIFNGEKKRRAPSDVDRRQEVLREMNEKPMNDPSPPGVAVYVCQRCIQPSVRLPRQWKQDGIPVRVAVLPCSGKTDAQYLFHSIESGALGVIVVACPRGECHLSQGNYRAEIRVHTLQRLLAEIGLEPERASLVHCAPGDDLQALIRGSVRPLQDLGENPIFRMAQLSGMDRDAPMGMKSETRGEQP
jgi:F420-non-reducing hydrogenase iron-sulfur subunit